MGNLVVVAIRFLYSVFGLPVSEMNKIIRDEAIVVESNGKDRNTLSDDTLNNADAVPSGLNNDGGELEGESPGLILTSFLLRRGAKKMEGAELLTILQKQND